MSAASLDADVLQLVFDSSSDCIKVLDLDGRLLHMNIGGAAVMELSHPGQFVGEDWTAFWSGSEHDEACGVLQAARDGGSGRFQGFLPTAKGSPKWWDTVVTPIRDADGQICRLLAVSRDISESRGLSHQLEATVGRLRAVIRATSEIVWRCDASQGNGTIVGLKEFSGMADCNGRAQWLALIHPDDRSIVDESSRSHAERGSDYVVSYRLRHHSDVFRWVEDRVVCLRNESGQVAEWVGVIRDVHDRVAATNALHESEERLRLALQASQVGIWDVDLRNGERRWSADLKAMLGLPRDTVESEPLLLGLVQPADRPIVEEAHRTAFRNQPTLSFRILRADTGEERWILSSGQAVLDETGVATRRLGTFQDITERKQIEQKLWNAANQDPLTGLPNRTLFNANLETAVCRAKANGTRVGLLIVDLDQFKEVNDTLGHHAGDVVLRETAQRLSLTHQGAVTVARLGGDEFAIVIPEAGSLDEISEGAAALVRNLRRPIRYQGSELTCRASVGVAVFPDHDQDSDELLKNADLALYAAKRSGRSRYAVFAPALKSAMRTRVSNIQRMRTALMRREIVPYYQPKVALQGSAVCGFEALLRWYDNGVLRTPAALMEAFDDPEIASQIGQQILDLVIEDILRWRESGLDVGHVAVNVSAAEFTRVDVADRWLSKLASVGLPCSILQMEVTETVFLGEGSDGVGRALTLLHDNGVSIALDDFGTGFASLTHLRRYPVDWLKIDQSFIRDLTDDAGARAIVSALVSLAHGIGLRLVAEGVETENQMAFLAEQGCDLAQGYLAARPMAGSHVPRFCKMWTGWDDRIAIPHRARDALGRRHR